MSLVEEFLTALATRKPSPHTLAAWSSCKYTAGADATPFCPAEDGVWYTSRMVLLRASRRASGWPPPVDHLWVAVVTLCLMGTLAAVDS